MTFNYKEITVSGGNASVHGVTGVINEIVDHLVTCGWSIDDDRRSQSGSSILTNTHKVVLVNNNGESGTSPNVYLTLTSGTAAATTATTIGMQVSGAYDNVAHAVPASGVKSPDTTTLSQLRTFTVDPDGYNRMWMAADQDALALVVNRQGDQFAVVDAGKGDNFLDDDLEPYGVYLSCNGALTSVASNVYGLVGNNGVYEVAANNDGSFLTYTYAASNQPTQGLGNEEPRFAGMPIAFVVQNTAPVQKGWVGFVKHKFAGASDVEGLPMIGEAVDLNSGQEFKVFGGATSFFLRKN